jgi:hypothetical protein
MTEFSFVFSDKPPSIGIAQLSGVPVKAQLGVLSDGRPGWRSLYENDQGLAYAARIEVFERLAALLRRLGGADFWDLFQVNGSQYGRYLVSCIWGPLERAHLYSTLLRRFYAEKNPSRIVSVNLAAANPIDRRAFEQFLNDFRIPNDSSDVAPRRDEHGYDHRRRVDGRYALHGYLGRERLVYTRNELSCSQQVPLSPGNGRVQFDTETRTASFVSDAVQGIYAEWRLRYLNLPGSRITFVVVDQGRAAAVVVKQSGVFACTPSGRRISFRLAKIGPTRGGYSLWIHRGKGYFACEGAKAARLPVFPLDQPNGLYISAVGTGDGECCLSRLIIIDTLDCEALNSRKQGFPVFCTKSGGLRDWWYRLQKPPTRTTSLFSPGAASVSVRRRKESLLEPPYLEGWAESLGRAGVGVDWILVTDPWKLDGDQVRDERDYYLYGRLAEQSAAIRTETREIVDRGNRELRSKSALVKKYLKDDLLVDLFFEQIDQNLSTVVEFVVNQRQANDILSNTIPTSMASPRLDSAYMWACFAARDLNVPSLSSEISFIYHEIHRLHLLCGLSESTGRIAVWGKAHLARLTELGLNSGNLSATGLHSLDYYRRSPSRFDFTSKQMDDYRKFLGLKLQSGPLILYGGYFGGNSPIYDLDELRRSIRACFSAMKWDGNVLMKTLPFDDPEVIRDVLKDFDQSRLHVLSPEQPFQNCHYYAAADAVVALPTTLLAEAAAQGCHCVAVWTGTHGNWYPVSKSYLDLLGRIMPVATREDELINRIAHNLSQTERFGPPDDAMRELFGSVKGSNAANLADLISELSRNEVGKSVG